MKKNVKLVTCMVLLMMVTMIFSSCKSDDKVQLNVYNWGDYIKKSVLEDFEKEYNISINYEEFATNEDMYIKLKQGGTNYDVVIPSDYMIEKMIKEDMLEKIDMKNITNYKEIDENLKNLVFDPKNEYSVPYLWGTVGIVYNSKVIKEKVNSWDILWDEKYKDQILMLDSSRDSIGIALKKLGYSFNSKNEKELAEAKQELIKQRPLVLAYVVDEGKDKMLSGEATIGVFWSGDAMVLAAENPDLKYVVPKEGSNLWFDSMVIPKGSKHKKEAELFINYLSQKDVAKKTAEYIMYYTPNVETKKMLGIEYPSLEQLNHCEIFRDPGEFIKNYDRIWTEVLAQ
ncbi:spermidine/putrescine ABC transporter substrate-binding protein [Clostridiaceae bacterium M8S5]|nr:spermidine/putrescine ABC transporter substrate-binding protein [Clostridiaceae bacterium M8S5]